MFNRSAYYSQTEVVKLFKLSVKQFKELIANQNIDVISREADLGGYTVTTVYVKKEEIDKLNLERRE